jgi:hypothetical protein
MQEAFRVIEPSGKTYHIYADGRITGFAEHATICNRIPCLMLEFAHKRSKESPFPTSEIKPSGDGRSHACAPISANCAEKMAAAPGEK